MSNKFNFSVFFMVLSVIGFTACSEDEDDNVPVFESSAIVGVWHIDAMTTTVVTSGGSETGVEKPDVLMDFKEDGTGLAANEMAFTWSLSDNLLSLEFERAEDTPAGPPMGGFTGGQFNFSFEDLAAFEEIVLSVTDLDESYLAVEYAGNYPGTSVTMVMELSR